MQEIIQASGLSESEILNQVKTELQGSNMATSSWCDDMQLDLKLYENQKQKSTLDVIRNNKLEDDFQMGDTTMDNVRRGFLSRMRREYLEPTFTSSEASDKLKLSALSEVWNDDITSPEYTYLLSQIYWDAITYNIAIVAPLGWDGVNKRPIFTTVDPITWRPDVNGNMLTGEYAFTGFSMMMTKDQMKALGYENIDMVSVMSGTDNNSAWDARRQQQEEAGIVPQNSYLSEGADQYEVYVHYGIFGGRKAMVVTDATTSVVLKSQLIEPKNKQQEADPSLIRFPVSFFYLNFPSRYDPYGKRMSDYTRDPQVALAILADLKLDKALMSLHTTYLYMKGKISEKDLANLHPRKHVPVDGSMGVPLSNMVTPIIRDTNTQTASMVEEDIRRQVERSTSLSEVAQGVAPENRDTATTNELIQSGVDLNMGDLQKNLSLGFVRFVYLWLDSYWENFADGDKKFIVGSKNFTTVPRLLKKKEFLIQYDPKITVVSSIEKERRRRENEIAAEQTIPFITGSPDIPQVSKRMAIRNLLIAKGKTREQALSEVGVTPQEMAQYNENLILSENVYVTIKPEDDHLVHIIVAGDCVDNDAVQAHIMAHRIALAQQGYESPSAPPQMSNNGNAAANQATGQIIANQLSDRGATNRQPGL